MPSPLHYLLPLLLLITAASAAASASFRPKALLLRIHKDPTTLQYTTSLLQRTPLITVPLTLDLGGPFLWVDCSSHYMSSTYRPIPCRSASCNLANSKACGTCTSPPSPSPGCNPNTCGVSPENPITRTATGGELAADVVGLESTNGVNPGRNVTVSRFLFGCGTTSLLKGLAKGVMGIGGLGRTKISLPAQFSAAFSFQRSFAMCLTSGGSSNGVVFFGPGPYVFLPGIDVSKSLIYTPLIINPVSTAVASFKGEPSSEYFIGVTSIQINGQDVPNLNKSLLSIDPNGNGGTKISTVHPYTLLQTSLFNAITDFFVSQVANVSRVAPVRPFKVCYSTRSFSSTRVGPGVPAVDLVLQSESVFWRMFGANTMVQVNDKVMCLGFVDGGKSPRTAVVIGGYQLEDNLLQFDLTRSRLGFSSTLLFRQTTCANFNFTSIAN